MNSVAYFVVSISFHTLALILAFSSSILHCIILAYMTAAITLMAMISIIDVALTLFSSISFICGNVTNNRE